MFLRAIVFSLFVCGCAPAALADEAKSGADFHAQIGPLRAAEPPRPVNAPADEDVNWWLYDVVLEERSGASGVTLTQWRKCYKDIHITLCEPRAANFDALFGTARIPPGGRIALKKPAWVWAARTGYTYTVSATYWGVDDAGQGVEASYSFQVTSQ